MPASCQKSYTNFHSISHSSLQWMTSPSFPLFFSSFPLFDTYFLILWDCFYFLLFYPTILRYKMLYNFKINFLRINFWNYIFQEIVLSVFLHPHFWHPKVLLLKSLYKFTETIMVPCSFSLDPFDNKSRKYRDYYSCLTS